MYSMKQERDSGRNERLEQLFHAATELQPDARAAFLEQQCSGDQDLRRMIDALLTADRRERSAVDTPLLHAQETAPAQRTESVTLPRGQRVASYEVVRLVASGGMGDVYEAWQLNPRRPVALKLLRANFASTSELRRFQFESELLGRLRHPNIAQVYEAGFHHTDGLVSVPFFAMEFVADAQPITDYARGKQLSIKDRLKLFIIVCEAVHHGHQKGVVHRDLKPHNILVDGGGTPRIIDYGVARALDSDIQLGTTRTSAGALVGTLQYMSPEQLRGGAEVDTRSDVYSLGLTLFELLADRPPIDLRGKSVADAVRCLTDASCPKLGEVAPALRGDLSTIVAKAVDRIADRRYQSSAELADDLRRYLQKRPIQARPPGRWYLLAMMMRRHRAMCALGAATVATLVIATGVSSLFAVRAERQRDIARNAETAANVQRESADYQAYVANIAAADAALRVYDVAEARRRLERAPQRLRNWEWSHLNSRLDASRRTLDGHQGVVEGVAFSADGAWIATGTGGWGTFDPVVRVWDAATGRLIKRLEGHTDAVGHVAFHPRDRYRLATASNDHTARVWDVRADAAIATLAHSSHVNQLAFSGDGRALATLDTYAAVRFWDLDTYQLVHAVDGLHPRVCHSMALFPEADRMVCGGQDGSVRVVNLPAGDDRTVMRGHTAAVMAVAISPDGQLVASASDDLSIRLWDANTGEARHTLHGHTAAVQGVLFAPAPAPWLASTSIDNTVRLWRLDASSTRTPGEPMVVLHGHEAATRAIAFSPDGEWLATGAADKTAKVWDVGNIDQPATLRGHEQLVRALVVSPDGQLVATGAFDRTVRVWNVAERREVVTLDATAQRVQAVAFHPKGHCLAAACGDGKVRLWTTDGWTQLRELPADADAVHALVYSPVGDYLATGGKESIVRIWDGETAEPLHNVELNADWIEFLACRPGVRPSPILAGCRNGQIHVIDPSTGKLIAVFNPGAGGITMVALSPDGTTGASAHFDGTVRIWSASTGSELRRLVGHSAIVNTVAFSPDGSRLVTAGNDTTVRLWDAATGESLMTLRAHQHWVHVAQFTPDGARIISGGGSYDGSDCALRIWETRRH